jgi:hypothetical protein
MQGTDRLERAERRIAALEARLEASAGDATARIWIVTILVVLAMCAVVFMSTDDALRTHSFDSARTLGQLEARLGGVDQRLESLGEQARHP